MPEISTPQSSYSFLAPLAAHTGQGVTAVYEAAVPTTTQPTAGVLYSNNPNNPNLIIVIPFADSVTAQTSIGMRLIGWSSLNQTSSVLWVPTVLFDSTLVSVSGATSRSVNGSTVYFMNSITAIIGTPTANLYHPAGGTGTTTSTDIASCVVDCTGSGIVQAQFKTSHASAWANMGCLWRTI